MSTKEIQHIAIIMDGNRRWAKKNNFEILKGYDIGSNAIKEAILGCLDNNIPYLTCYAFSVDNWKRSKVEIEFLKKLLLSYLSKYREEFFDKKVKFKVIGDYSQFGEEISKKIDKLIEDTESFSKMTFSLALNYGAQQEIVRAVNNIILDIKSGNFRDSEVTIDNLDNYLYTANIPKPNFIIRTGGEKRLSNFLLWQASYSEFIFYDFMWPEFKASHIKEAMEEFNKRELRHGV